MQKKAKKVLVLAIGVIFIIIGFFGLFLPFLQGLIFLAIGLVLVSLCLPKVRLKIKKHAERNHHLSSAMNRLEKWLAEFIGEI